MMMLSIFKRITMKRVKVLFLALLAVATMNATPTITHSGDTLVITVNATGDLKATNFTSDQLASTNVKIVTADGVTLSATDFTDFFGTSYTTPPFSKITDLNMGLAELARDNVITPLGHNSKFLNGGNELGTLVLPECLTSTKFSFNDNLSKWTRVIFPNATKSKNLATTVIGASTFSGDKYLKSLVIGTSVNSIKSQAFVDCSNLTNVEYLYGLKKISSQAFANCTGLTSLILPGSLETIGVGAFQRCKNITTVRLPNSLKTIKSQAFDQTGITTVVIPASVETVENLAFGNIDKLTDVYVLGTNTKCAAQSFQTDYTYGYSLSSYTNTNGGTVKITDYTTRTGVYTILHYPEAAYSNYVNKYTQLIGTNAYNQQSKYGSWNNKWVFDEDGNKLPVGDYGYFSGLSGDYAGWNEFMLVGKLKNTHEDTRLVEGKWYSVCFPFDLSAKQIGNAFGSATEVCEFSGVESLDDPNVPNRKYIVLNFKTPVTEMKAHHPYMIHPGLHGTAFNTIVDVADDTDTDGDNFAKKLKAQAKSYTVDGVTYTFIGNYTTGAKIPKYSYYYYSGDESKWANGFYKAMRTDAVFTPGTAIVQLDKDNGISGAKTAYFSNRLYETTTGIDNISANGSGFRKASLAGKDVYNIYGQVVRRGTTDTAGLPSGIYIVNGKKLIVK